MRSEQMERLRRRCEEERVAAIASGTTHPWDPDKPWDFCLKAASLDRKFWDEELDRKCVLFTHLRTQRQLTGDGHGAELPSDGGHHHGQGGGGPRGTAGGGGVQKPAPRKRQRNGQNSGNNGAGSTAGGNTGGGGAKGKGKGKARLPDGRWRDSRVELRWTWNHSAEGCSEVCLHSRAHQCEWCRAQQHRSVGACPRKPAGWIPPGR